MGLEGEKYLTFNVFGETVTFHLVFTQNMHGENFAKTFWGTYIFRHPYHSNSIKTIQKTKYA